LYSDSSYLVDAFDKKWIDRWKLKGWINQSKDEVKNIDLWKKLDKLSETHKIKWIKVKGHSDNENNNRCDKLATDIIKENKPSNGEMQTEK
jgi:ribonuclease HI